MIYKILGFFPLKLGFFHAVRPVELYIGYQNLNVAFWIRVRSVRLASPIFLHRLIRLLLPRTETVTDSLIKPSLINYTWFPFSVTLESARRWRLCYKKVWVHAFIIILRSKPISIQKFWVMANGMVFLSDLQTGRSSSSIQVCLLRCWEARNVWRGGELMEVDMLFLDFHVICLILLLFRFLIISPVKFYTNCHRLDSRYNNNSLRFGVLAVE